MIVGRNFHLLDENDENYVQLHYEPFLIEYDVIMHNKAIATINHFPIKNLKERIELQLGHLAIEDAKAAVEALLHPEVEVVKKPETETVKEAEIKKEN